MTAYDPSAFLDDLATPLPAGLRLQRVVTRLRAQFGCDAVALLGLQNSDGPACLRPVATAGLVRDALGRRFRLDEQPRLAAIMATGPLSALQPPPGSLATPTAEQLHRVVGFEQDSRLPDPYDGLIDDRLGEPLPVHDCMGVRLLQDGQPWGALTLDGLNPGRFDAAAREALAQAARLVEAAVRVSRLEQENDALRHSRAVAQRSQEDDGLPVAGAGDDWEIVAHSEAMRRLLEESRMVAASDLPVLLLGETGVGKELFARRLHRLSPRHQRPLVHVNCAALPETLAESELFGHVRGAYSGASGDRAGRVEAAEGGTLFLDEVGELPLQLQAKLLRTLQNGEIQRLGSDRPRKVDVRFIAATNRDLQAAVREGHFRADFYHRLSVYPLPIPPLRLRPDDVLPMAGRFLELNRARLGLRSLRLAPPAERALLAYPWPGNVRELEHVIGRAALRAAGAQDARVSIVTIDLDLLGLEPQIGPSPAPRPPDTAGADSALPSLPLQAGPAWPEGATLKDITDATQRRCVEAALQACQGNWAQAARRLGIDSSNLHKLAHRLGMK
ncbi:MAG: nitric oxide reductase transcriptional regulator NorR [Burkholderiales bacterium]|jgi:anaerobic nitric oxide reductase transcription regulator|nr:nitric oxide reductase transcriptional regulator NorR [Burkholderiales bacterium]MBP7522611.1 nitric oxide reductase transcriptional regulator NorR [Leptothrix sp. (in: b-proteobacteria)]HQY09338.1 nitric oxide reductase transcriptional regulator NorR [Burkholderiaceae bacterium]